MGQIWNENNERLSQLVIKCDVLLLADVSEKFRSNSLKNYGVCPRHYLSAPSLSWDAMLNITKVELALITDPDMYIFFEKDTKSGVSYISNRYIKASNNYLKSYNPKQELKHIYFDVNSFCGYVISKFLPTSAFKWIDHKELLE